MKTLYIDIDEDISSVVEKVAKINADNLLLVIPQDALLFSNTLHLKLLQNTLNEKKTPFHIFTNDERGIRMAKKLGIKLYQGHLRKRSTHKNPEFKKLNHTGPMKKKEKKVTITEISSNTRSTERAKASLSKPTKRLKKQEQREWSRFYLFNTLKKRTLLGFCAVAFLASMSVMYIAIPSATIDLIPSSNVVETTVNITIANQEGAQELFRRPNAHVIPVAPIELEIEKSLLYQSTGRVFTGKNARCNLKIVNEKTSAWKLIPKTRFQTPDGIIYRMNESLSVPAARYQVLKDEDGNPRREKTPGSLVVSVVADERDVGGNIIGARGNLKAGVSFSLPGLSEYNQELLYAKNEQPCKGGVSDSYTIVTEDDIEAAQQKMRDLLEVSAREELKAYVDGENLKRTDLVADGHYAPELIFFDNPSAIKNEILSIELPENLLNQQVSEFSVKGTVKSRAIAYPQQPYYELLEEGLLAKIHPQKVLSDIEYDSATYNIVYSDSELEDLSRVKLSVSVRGIEEYNFDPRSERGKELVNKIMETIPGKNITDASYYMANLEEIQKADISVWPFWKQEIPTRQSSITLRVE